MNTHRLDLSLRFKHKVHAKQNIEQFHTCYMFNLGGCCHTLLGVGRPMPILEIHNYCSTGFKWYWQLETILFVCVVGDRPRLEVKVLLMCFQLPSWLAHLNKWESLGFASCRVDMFVWRDFTHSAKPGELFTSKF